MISFSSRKDILILEYYDNVDILSITKQSIH